MPKIPLTSHSSLYFVSKICGKSKLRFSLKVLNVISRSGAVTNQYTQTKKQLICSWNMSAWVKQYQSSSKYFLIHVL